MLRLQRGDLLLELLNLLAEFDVRRAGLQGAAGQGERG